jgi:cellobiose-specific phosphotransferase system component IIC
MAGSSFNINLGDEVSSRVSINSDLGTFVERVFSAIIIVAAIATLMYMVYGGVQWVTSGGEKDKITEARSKITNALIGLAVVASAWAIFLLVDYFFGIGITN